MDKQDKLLRFYQIDLMVQLLRLSVVSYPLIFGETVAAAFPLFDYLQTN